MEPSPDSSVGTMTEEKVENFQQGSGRTTLQHFDFVDSDEESTETEQIIGTVTGQNSSCKPKRMKRKMYSGKTGPSITATDKPHATDTSTGRKQSSKVHLNKQDSLKDVKNNNGLTTEDGSSPSSVTDTSALSPLKESHISCSLGTGDNTESSLRPSLLDEVLSEKKLLLMRSPEVVKFFKRQQCLLAKRSCNLQKLTSATNSVDKTINKN